MKKKVLMIIPFENLYPPTNGGLQRCFHLLHQLSKYTDLTALTWDPREKIMAAVSQYPALANAKIYSVANGKPAVDLFSVFPEKIANALRYRWLIKDFSRTADGWFLNTYVSLKKILTENSFDIILLENLPLTYYSKWIRKYHTGGKIFFNAYNVEYTLAMRGNPRTPEQLKAARDLLNVESHIYKVAEGIFCCSQLDLDEFQKMNNHRIQYGYVLPNGVDITRLSYNYSNNEKRAANILFCGSLDYAPNKEGLLWFYKNVWAAVQKQLPNARLHVVGRGGVNDYEEMRNDPKVRFIGEVDDVIPFYRECSVAIAPLMNGSGTRFKILEAMSLGNPVLTTTIGAEGIDYVDGYNIVIADSPETFAEKLVALSLGNIDNITISENARSLVGEKYSWDVIGASLNDFLLLL